MKEVLELIEKKKVEFANLPFFKFLKNTSIDPRQRMIWVPCAIPFIMGAKDVNNCALRVEPTNDPIQKIINVHTREDGRHWKWLLKDLENLGLDESLKFTDTLKFLWGDETLKARNLAYTLALHTFASDPLVKLVAIEVIEATGNVAFSAFAEVGNELQQMTQKRYRYFSTSHLAVETGHIHGYEDDVEQFLAEIQLTDEQKAIAIEMVEKVFTAFTEFVNYLMEYSEEHSIEQKFIKSGFTQASLCAA
jgi:hypothetical protein